MSTKKELIEEVLSLPIEDRTMIVNSLLESMNPINDEIDRKWVQVAKNRLHELQSGQVQGIPGDKVFNKIWERFSK